MTKLKIWIVALLLAIVMGASFLWIRPTRGLKMGRLRAVHYQLGGYSPSFAAGHSGDRGTLFILSPDLPRESVEELQRGGSNVVLAPLSLEEPDQSRAMKIAKIQGAGFDGIYLTGTEEALARSSMAPSDAAYQLVQRIAKVASEPRRTQRHFVVVLQNGACLPVQSTYPMAYESVYRTISELFWASIDGVVLESALFPGKRAEDNDFVPRQDVFECLKPYPGRGKPVFDVEYLRDPAKQKQALEAVTVRGLTGLVTDGARQGEIMLKMPAR